jgi:hypothetical protein
LLIARHVTLFAEEFHGHDHRGAVRKKRVAHTQPLGVQRQFRAAMTHKETYICPVPKPRNLGSQSTYRVVRVHLQSGRENGAGADRFDGYRPLALLGSNSVMAALV